MKSFNFANWCIGRCQKVPQFDFQCQFSENSTTSIAILMVITTSVLGLEKEGKRWRKLTKQKTRH